MCLMLTFAFVVATLAFLSHGLVIQAVISGIIATVALSYFVYNIYSKRHCLFGDNTVCKH